MPTVARAIREYRTNKNLSQRDLAARLDVSQMAVSHWENGTGPSMRTLPGLAGELLNNGTRDNLERLNKIALANPDIIDDLADIATILSR